MILFKIKDETSGGDIINEIECKIESERILVRDLIALRVRTEVEAYNNKVPEYFYGLVKPTESEKTLNGFRLLNKKWLDVEGQIYVALEAFQKNGFFVLVDNRQCESLDEELLVNSESEISFLKLTQLVGG
ncbi:hypothetical protein [Roseivirga sp.]|uniref:hypothetical protein n=1 Tax=Roseivirga sp. TaxID=1964215 RepID=UPI003B522ED6